MNSTIEQLVVLTIFGNATLRGRFPVPRVFPENPTCRFCDRVVFVAAGKSFFGAPREKRVGATPDDWFEYLARHDAQAVGMRWQAQNDPRIADHKSAAFAGGGGDFALAVRYAERTELWRSRWEVWNRNAPQQRIWRVTYGPPVQAAGAAAETQPDALDPGALRAALADILTFARAHDTGEFSTCFLTAIESLDGAKAGQPLPAELYPPNVLSIEAVAVLDAARKAWVFGGMGSWNDMRFEGEIGREYERVSSRLYAALTRAICAAANQSAA